MNKFKKFLFSLVFLFLLVLARPVQARAGARVFFDPATGSYSVGDEFSVKLEVDPAGQDIYAVDSIINFDANKLEIIEVEVKNYFVDPTGNEQQGSRFDFDQETGSLVIYSFANILDISMNTPGTIAVIKFKALAEGVASVTFVCDPDVDGDTTIWPPEGDGITDCAAVGSGSYTIGGGSVVSTPTPTISQDLPTATPTPTSGSGGESDPTATPTDSELPESGIIEPLLLTVVLGSLMVGLGFFGLIW
ncbi:hypothetical protein ISS42_02665 [Candidatus Shapirobacteria bacterium]|nr:hypothetical protein [Candidatus Shapirobacteria bacterium]